LFRDIDQIIVRQQFTTSPKDFILLCEISWKEKNSDPNEILRGLIDDIDVMKDFLHIKDEKGKTLCFIMGEHDIRYTELFIYTTREFLCFIEYPLVARGDFGILNLVGVPQDVMKLIAFMQEFGSNFEIVAITNYVPKDTGILSVLTDKQLAVLKEAYEYGFFEHPRTTPSRVIAAELGIAHTTFLTHIRKSLKRIFQNLLE
jgi:predicted DNA binding protein